MRTTAADGPPSGADALPSRDERVSDAELVARLRRGDGSAYEELWTRHVAVALRVARRLAPNDADDLVSDAFIAVHQQIVERGAGPDDGFRAYLLATVRNNAVRLHREAARLPIDEEGEPVDEHDGLSLVEDEDGARSLLGAFNALPDRWQRVLWLAEVERVKRPVIASHFGLRPNAVSVLHRRAKDGLRVEWLKRQIPEARLADPAHAAAGIPAVIVGTASARDRAKALEHLTACAGCRELDRDLRAVYGTVPDVALSTIGFAALGVTLPAAAATVWSVPAGTAAAATIGLAIVGSAAAVLGLVAGDVTATGAVERAALPAPPAAIAQAPGDETPAAAPQPAPAAAPDAAAETDARIAPAGETVAPAVAIPAIDFWYDDAAPDRPAPPAPQPAEPGSVPQPEHPDSGPAVPQGEDGRPNAPTYAMEQPSTSQLPPTFSGTAEPGDRVAVQVDDAVYAVDPDESGAWTFDLRPLPLEAGPHTATIWSFSGDRASTPQTAEFVIERIVVEGLGEYTPMTLRESSGDGLVVTATGIPGSTVCMRSDSGQSAVVTLDESGTAVRRLRLIGYGLYVIQVVACDGAFSGPAKQGENSGVVSVNEGLVDPWLDEPGQRVEFDEV